MTINETILSLQLLLQNTSDEGETEKRTYINDIKPSSTIFILSTAIDHLQEIKAESRTHGLWIPIDGEPYAKCSNCGEKHYGCVTPFCDMCGACMDAQYVDTDSIYI